MTEQESDELVLYLHSGRIDWAGRITQPVLRVWYDQLRWLLVDLCQEAARSFFAQRAPATQGFPPDVGEFIRHVDRVGSAKVMARHAELADNRAEAAKLLTGPASAWGERGSLGRLAAQLVRELCDGTLTPHSEEHVARQAEVERLAGPSRAPCACEQGLVHYTIMRWGRPYAYVGRCACRLGDDRPGYLTVSAETGRP